MLDHNSESALQIAMKMGQNAFVEAFSAVTKTKVKTVPKPLPNSPQRFNYHVVRMWSLFFFFFCLLVGF